MTNQKGQFRFISFSNLGKIRSYHSGGRERAILFSRQRPSLDVCVAHIEEHAVDVARVAPVLVSELVVAEIVTEFHYAVFHNHAV